MSAFATPANKHLLVVDDDRDIRVLLDQFLTKQGYSVSTAADHREMQAILDKEKIHLVVLDLMLPGMDGLAICKELRETSKIPIVMLTALGEENDKIRGFKEGVDDYLAKPFNPQELLARVTAVLRRTDMLPPLPKDQFNRVLQFGDWRLDMAVRQLTSLSGTLIDLSAAEYDLLAVFVEHPKRVLSRDLLLDLTRGQVEIPFDRKIDMQVSRLRRKIEDDPKNPTLIQTVRGGGYVFSAEVLVDAQPAA
ncbi:MAG: response regulator [Alphaproteobacteria bacterium]|nr:response regulator [Alphaproteobacteria bacterium]